MSFNLNNRECKEVLKKTMAHKLAYPFHEPVDTVRHGLVDYFDRIKHPMDLGTIRSNLQRSAYKDGSAFVSDVRLVFSNAITYNPPGHDVHVMALAVSEEFERLVKGYATRPAAAAPPPAAAAAYAEPDVEAIPELTSRQMSQLLNAVKRTDEASWYFNEPVDPERFGIPDYFSKIAHPMDLGTIESRMDKGMYSDTASFVADVRLVWSNAKSYNAPGTSVHVCAQKLEDLFEKELRKACGGSNASLKAGAPAPSRQPSLAPPKLTLQTDLAMQHADPAETSELVTAACKPIVAKLRSHNAAKTFNLPVDCKKYPMYRDKIATPMDLKTVMRKLDKGEYATIASCHADVDLIWENCRVFNGDGSWVTNHAMTLKAIADPQFHQARHKLATGGIVSPRGGGGVKRKLGSSGLTPRPTVVASNELCCITPEMRAQLSTNAARLDAAQLRSLMSVVKQCEPTAVRSTSTQSWEIDVDLLDITSFVKVDTWVRRLLVNKPVAC